MKENQVEQLLEVRCPKCGEKISQEILVNLLRESEKD